MTRGLWRFYSKLVLRVPNLNFSYGPLIFSFYIYVKLARDSGFRIHLVL